MNLKWKRNILRRKNSLNKVEKERHLYIKINKTGLINNNQSNKDLSNLKKE